MGVHVRRCGFRAGTDAELAAMHVVETEIQAERRPGAPPPPLESYISFARNLPTQFDDHTWLAEDDDGTPVGCAACWSDSAGDPRVMESYVYVRPGWRRRGIGRQLARAIVDAAASEGRARLIWASYDTAPAGDEFARSLGGAVARVNRNSELQLADVDWTLVRSWVRDGSRRAVGYTLDFWEGPYPAALAADAATFHHIMQTAPRDDLDVGDVALAPEHVLELDRALVESGRQRWTIFVRDPDGQCVGGTEMTFEPWEPSLAQQQNTGIHPEHRGLGLAKWAKATMLERVRDHRPAVTKVRTGNAFSNAPMLAINNALGFAVVEVVSEWQGDVRRLAATVASGVG